MANLAYEILSDLTKIAKLRVGLLRTRPAYPYVLADFQDVDWTTYQEALPDEVTLDNTQVFLAIMHCKAKFNFQGPEQETQVWGAYVTYVGSGSPQLFYVHEFSTADDKTARQGEVIYQMSLGALSE